MEKHVLIDINDIFTFALDSMPFLLKTLARRLAMSEWLTMQSLFLLHRAVEAFFDLDFFLIFTKQVLLSSGNPFKGMSHRFCIVGMGISKI